MSLMCSYLIELYSFIAFLIKTTFILSLTFVIVVFIYCIDNNCIKNKTRVVKAFKIGLFVFIVSVILCGLLPSEALLEQMIMELTK